MKRTIPTIRAEARVIALRRDDEGVGTRRALWLKIGLVSVAILVFVLAGTFPAGAEQLFPKILPLPNGFAPEGIATGRGTDFYVGSLAGGAIYKGDLRTGEGDVLAQAVSGRAIAGVKVDKRTNYVFASGTQSGKAFVFDGNTGAQLAAYQLASALPSFINDVVITRDAAYFTDSFRPYFYKLPLGLDGSLPPQSAVQEILLKGEWEQLSGFNSNGIESNYGGRALIIMHSGLASLFAVDPATGVAIKIDLGGAALPNGDGILLDQFDGKTLYVMQNRLNQISVVELKLTEVSGTITKVITDPAFRVPTTIAQYGPWLYAVNARFGTPVTPDTEYEAVQVNK